MIETKKIQFAFLGLIVLSLAWLWLMMSSTEDYGPADEMKMIHISPEHALENNREK